MHIIPKIVASSILICTISISQMAGCTHTSTGQKDFNSEKNSSVIDTTEAEDRTTKNAIQMGQLFPLQEIPSEFTMDFEKFSESSTSVDYNRNQENLLENPKNTSSDSESIRDKNIEVYFDTTKFCFMPYLDKQNGNAWDTFVASMKAFRNAFEFAQSYTTYTLDQQDGYLSWMVYDSDNARFFMNYCDKSIYTENKGSFRDGESPMSMWVEKLEEQANQEESPISIYISDMDEQNVILSEQGGRLRTLLDNDESKDFLLIAYTLKYTGDEISQPNLRTEGNKKISTENIRVVENADRKYYVAAFGDRASLNALKETIKMNFDEISKELEVELNPEIFQYREFQESKHQESIVTFTDAAENEINDNTIRNYPPQISILDVNGNSIAESVASTEVTTEVSNEKRSFGSSTTAQSSNSGLKYLELCNDISPFFVSDLTGEVYAFQNIVPNMEQPNTGLSLRLENTDVYQLDTKNASVYVYYVPDTSKKSFSSGESAGWKEEIPEKTAISFIKDSVKLELNTELTQDSIPVIAVSIPVNIPYSKTTTVTEYTDAGKVSVMVEHCNAPKKSSQEPEMNIRTYDFDAFMNQLTDYKSMESAKVISEETETDLVLKADRLNLLIIASEKS